MILHPDSAVYRLRFSYVGEGMGNYNPVNSATNGKVFHWQAPLNGIKQGRYEPLALLITPRKKQVFSIGGVQQLTDLTHATFELALTNNDPNTFSRLDANENMGYALNVGLDQDLLRRDTSRMRFLGSVHYRHTSHNFRGTGTWRILKRWMNTSQVWACGSLKKKQDKLHFSQNISAGAMDLKE